MAKQIYCSEFVFSAKDMKNLIDQIKVDLLDTTSISVRVLIDEEHEGKVFKLEVIAIAISDTDNKSLPNIEPASGCPRPPGCNSQ